MTVKSEYTAYYIKSTSRSLHFNPFEAGTVSRNIKDLFTVWMYYFLTNKHKCVLTLIIYFDIVPKSDYLVLRKVDLYEKCHQL